MLSQVSLCPHIASCWQQKPCWLNSPWKAGDAWLGHKQSPRWSSCRLQVSLVTTALQVCAKGRGSGLSIVGVGNANHNGQQSTRCIQKVILKTCELPSCNILIRSSELSR